LKAASFKLNAFLHDQPLVGRRRQPAFLSRSLLVGSQVELPHIRALAAAPNAKMCLDTPATNAATSYNAFELLTPEERLSI
jgi:hypothetical protein